MSIISHKKNMLLVIPFGITLIVLNVIRMFNVPITHDETGYVPSYTYLDLLTEKIVSANNHILHSVCRKFFVELFGFHLFTLRLDSCLALIGFIVMSYLVCKVLFKNNWWLLCSFIMLNMSTPFVFNFWGLSRGYALGMFFMTTSIYFLLSYIGTFKPKLLLFSLLAGILTVESNFGLLNFFIALAGVIVLQQLFFRRNAEQKKLIPTEWGYLLGAVVVLALLITHPLIKLHGGGELAYLGKNGFIEDTVGSLCRCSIYGSSNEAAIMQVLPWLVVGLFWLMVVYWLFKYFKLKLHTTIADVNVKYGFILTLLVAIPVLSLIAQFLLLGINYLIDRTAVFFIILFFLQLTFFLYSLSVLLPRLATSVFVLFFSIVIVHFVQKFDYDRVLLWWFDAPDVAILHKMANDSKDKKGKIKVCMNWLFIPAFETYDMPHYYNGRFDKIVKFGEANPADSEAFDFYYVQWDEAEKVPQSYVVDTQVFGGGFKLFKKVDTLPAAKQ